MKLIIPNQESQKKQFERLSISIDTTCSDKLNAISEHIKSKSRTSTIEVLINSVFDNLKLKLK